MTSSASRGRPDSPRVVTDSAALSQVLRKARTDEKPLMELELALMRRLVTALEAGCPIRSLDFTEDEERLLRSFQFLTAKPEIVAVNLGEDDAPDAPF